MSKSGTKKLQIDLTGNTYNRLTALEQLPERSKSRQIVWRCACVCGNEHKVQTRDLTSGVVKSCGCLQKDRPNHKSRLRPFESTYNNLLRESKKRGHVVTLTYEEFVVLTRSPKCHYCEAELEWNEYQCNDSSSAYNLDRKENRSGYTADNCVPCCRKCNYGKGSTFTYEEWKDIGNLLRLRRIMESIRSPK